MSSFNPSKIWVCLFHCSTEFLPHTKAMVLSVKFKTSSQARSKCESKICESSVMRTDANSLFFDETLSLFFLFTSACPEGSKRWGWFYPWRINNILLARYCFEWSYYCISLSKRDVRFCAFFLSAVQSHLIIQYCFDFKSRTWFSILPSRWDPDAQQNTFPSPCSELRSPPIIFLRLGSSEMDHRGRSTRKLRSTVKLVAFGRRPKMLTATMQKSSTFQTSLKYDCFPLQTP
jgi:hypothetical protein